MISALVAVAVGLATTAVTFAYWDRIKKLVKYSSCRPIRKGIWIWC